MAQEMGTDRRSVDSVDELSVGDGIYSEASDTPYWVVNVTDSEISLVDRDESPYSWRRETFEESLDSHTWVHQVRAPKNGE